MQYTYPECMDLLLLSVTHDTVTDQRNNMTCNRCQARGTFQSSSSLYSGCPLFFNTDSLLLFQDQKLCKSLTYWHWSGNSRWQKICCLLNLCKLSATVSNSTQSESLVLHYGS